MRKFQLGMSAETGLELYEVANNIGVDDFKLFVVIYAQLSI